ncbi:MAG: molecular chaperone [Candidatus Eremiobacteraeota bacterium]|nr:molecular chaperone [Candidatus Eremiobacteraeota bacterium]
MKTLLKVLAFASAFAVAVTALPAAAGQFGVQPIKVFLSKDTTSVLLSVENESDSPLRAQITGFMWTESAGGKMDLTPTDDLVYFPTLITMGPHEVRSVRVGLATSPVTPVEKSYRVFIEELPTLESQLAPAKGAHLTVRTKVGIPIFLEPANGTMKAAIGQAKIESGKLDVAVTNQGSLHVMIDSVKVVAKDSAGHEVFNKSIRGWYVMPSEERDFAIAIPKAACSKADSYDVTADSDVGLLTTHVSGDQGACR